MKWKPRVVLLVIFTGLLTFASQAESASPICPSIAEIKSLIVFDKTIWLHDGDFEFYTSEPLMIKGHTWHTLVPSRTGYAGAQNAIDKIYGQDSLSALPHDHVYQCSYHSTLDSLVIKNTNIVWDISSVTYE